MQIVYKGNQGKSVHTNPYKVFVFGFQTPLCIICFLFAYTIF